MTWFRPLPHFLAHPTPEPSCPIVCPFRRYCPAHVQAGVIKSFESGQVRGVADCFYHQGLAQLVRDDFGKDVPSSPEAFHELVAERVGIQEEV